MVLTRLYGYDTLIPETAHQTCKRILIEEFKKSGMTKTELAKCMGLNETQARRILNPNDGTKLATMDKAMRILGKRFVIGLE